MKTGTAFALVFFGLMLAGSAAQAAEVCLSTFDMMDTKPNHDGSAIFVTMRDGSVWRNDLHGRCPTLNFDAGFTWRIVRPDYTICENENALRVRPSGETCWLGKFTQVRPAR